jgi:hypothetical protein
MRYLIATILVAASCSLQAQVKYQASIEGGLMNGSWQTNGYVQTTHGIHYKQWFAGVGVGIDYYRYRTIPVFAELRRTFGRHGVQPFVVAAAGINATWPNEQQKLENNGWWQTSTSDFHNGFYSRVGAGVILNAGKKVRFGVNIAYNYKTLSRTYTGWIFEPWPQPTSSTEKTMEYKLNRLSIGFSIMF